MGDVILTSALLPVLSRLFPQATIDYWVREPFVDLFEQSSGFTALSERPSGPYDLVIDPLLDYPLHSAKEAASFDATWSIGFDVAGRGRWFTHPVAPPKTDEHFLKSLGRLLVPLGFENDVPPPALEVTALERGNAREMTGFDGAYILIHPGAFYASQRWPVAHVAHLVEMLEEQGHDVVVIGGTGDEAVLDEIHHCLPRFDRACFLCGLPLRTVMALMAEASVVLCNNSGPLHLASAFDVPTVSTLGPTNPEIWWPSGTRQRVVEAPDCSHCERGDCKRGCLARIAPEQALEEIRSLLKGQD